MNTHNHHRVVETQENSEYGFVSVYWIEEMTIKKVGFFKRRTVVEWKLKASGVYLHGHGWLDLGIKRKFYDKEQAIRQCQIYNGEINEDVRVIY